MSIGNYIHELSEHVTGIQTALIGLVVLTINPLLTIDVNFYHVVINVIVDTIKVICQLLISGLTIYLMVIKIKNEKRKPNEKN